VNNPADNYWQTILLFAWNPVSQFWFLYSLLLLHLLSLAGATGVRTGRTSLSAACLLQAAGSIELLPAPI